MRIALLSCLHPYRGGISQFNSSLMDGLGKWHDIKGWNFSRQYPSLLFPGKTQYVPEEELSARPKAPATLDTLNPFSWGKTAREIRAWGPDVLVLPYWMSWFAPSLGYVARHAGCKCIALAHNVLPHEPHWFDKPLTRYFLKGCHGMVCLSGEQLEQARALCPGKPALQLFHPLYAQFGERLPREQAAAALGINPGMKTLLFFGLIRPYKGLDILLEAFRELPEDYQLVVAGEPYGDFTPYQQIIDSLPGKNRIFLFPEFIPDAAVGRYFSAADLVVLPYRSATQSGVGAIATHFGTPLLVTDVGGLREEVEGAGTGIVAARPDSACVREEILRYFGDESLRKRCAEGIGREKERRSWDSFCRSLAGFASTL